MAATLASSALAALAPARAVAHRGRGAVAAPTLTPSRVTLRGAPLRGQHSRRSVPAAPSAAGRGGVKRVLAMAAATSVRIIIQGRHLEVTPGIRDHCEDKIVKAIKNFEGNIKEVDVKLSVRGGDAGTGARAQRVELTLYTLRHGVVRAEDVEDSLYAAIDLVCDKVRGRPRLGPPTPGSGNTTRRPDPTLPHRPPLSMAYTRDQTSAYPRTLWAPDSAPRIIGIQDTPPLLTGVVLPQPRFLGSLSPELPTSFVAVALATAPS